MVNSAPILGAHTQVVDATAIAAEDNSYDLVVFAQAFHHSLPPATAVARSPKQIQVGRRFLVIDLKRPSALGLVLTQVIVAPAWRLSRCWRDRRFGTSCTTASSARVARLQPLAFVALGKAADPVMHIEFPLTAMRFGPTSTSLVFSPGRSLTSHDCATSM